MNYTKTCASKMNSTERTVSRELLYTSLVPVPDYNSSQRDTLWWTLIIVQYALFLLFMFLLSFPFVKYAPRLIETQTNISDW